MAKSDKVEESAELRAEEPKEEAMAKGAVNPHEGLVKMHRDGRHIHAHPTVVKEHEKNGWKVA
jgi:hypothetical protein